MKSQPIRISKLILLAVLALVSTTQTVSAQVTVNKADQEPATTQEPLDDSAVAEGGLKTSHDAVKQQELFEKFVSSMNNTVMIGRFTIDGMDEGKRREERYEIKRVVKADEGDYWNIFARMKFGKVDVTLPFPVEVKWAGSTPVITVDDLKLIGMGDAFDARVVISDNKYAGTWRHGKVGGLMFGRIEPAPKKAGNKDGESATAPGNAAKAKEAAASE